MNREVLERIFRKVDKTTSACWLWLGGKNAYGYGRVSVGGRMHQPHRIVYEIMVGEIPEGKEIDHLCRIRNCVNPAHLEVVTHRENVRRGINQNKRKTHCMRGHELSGDNVIWRERPNRAISRLCRICRKGERERRILRAVA